MGASITIDAHNRLITVNLLLSYPLLKEKRAIGQPSTAQKELENRILSFSVLIRKEVRFKDAVLRPTDNRDAVVKPHQRRHQRGQGSELQAWESVLTSGMKKGRKALQKGLNKGLSEITPWKVFSR